MPDLLAAADFVVLPSRIEGLPSVLLEAFAAGRAVVATDAGGVREALTDGCEGRLVAVGDGAALGDAMVELAAHPRLREAMAQRGRARVERDFRLDSATRTARSALRALAGDGTWAARPRVLSRKILHLRSSRSLAGPERHLLELLPGLGTRGFAVGSRAALSAPPGGSRRPSGARAPRGGGYPRFQIDDAGRPGGSARRAVAERLAPRRPRGAARTRSEVGLGDRRRRADGRPAAPGGSCPAPRDPASLYPRVAAAAPLSSSRPAAPAPIRRRHCGDVGARGGARGPAPAPA